MYVGRGIMLINTKVKKVNLNTDSGFCKIYMDNGDSFWGTDIYFMSDFVDYIQMLINEDQMSFLESTSWILDTRELREEWEGTLSKLGAKDVLFLKRS